MSGLCGWLDLTGQDLPKNALAPVMAALRQRGPDGSAQWQDGPIALGHTRLITTPEAAREMMPLKEPESGCVITGDIRLDNRDGLLPALGLAEGGTGDGALVLAAYLRWGEDCLARLEGDFAFAIWDPRAGGLFCARDRMGMRPFLYSHAPGSGFAFSSEEDSLPLLPSVSGRLDVRRIGDLLFEEYEYRNAEDTFFETVRRLPAAHWLRVDRTGLKMARYWALSPVDPLRLPSDDAYAEAFRDALNASLRPRLRGVKPVACMLSGGMDSGAIAGLIGRERIASGQEPLATVSAVGPDPAQCRETWMIHQALTMRGITSDCVRLDAMEDIIDDLCAQTLSLKDPFDGPMTLLRAVYTKAHRAGHKVVLDGAGGDLLFACGSPVAAHLRSGRLLPAWRELQAEKEHWANHFALPVGRTLLQNMWRAWMPTWIRSARARRLNRAWQPDHARSLASPKFLGRTGYWAELVAEKTARDVDIEPDQVRRARTIGGLLGIVARERYNRVASQLAIEPRDPYSDPRLAQFVLSLPISQLQRDGFPKWIQRNAMRGILPDAVRWRKGFDHLGASFTGAVLQHMHNRGLFDPVDALRQVDPVAAEALGDQSVDLSDGVADEATYLLIWAARVAGSADMAR
ncbi:asparagine synthase-related protein [Cognatishimia sp. F0-27]|uniref:asparagine synthase-related protein n=1 Tax=Cognatishimia sp. F0-27 TaxID=2816855 RepID=UPI001D0C73F0|nr:asparagine synthase-related protein [Cognatishimia sp. F0-27]MCC1493808.1 hypothetical protein [Cognatishimia sp. F0-27]